MGVSLRIRILLWLPLVPGDPRNTLPSPTFCFLSFREGINLMVSRRHFHAEFRDIACLLGEPPSAFGALEILLA